MTDVPPDDDRRTAKQPRLGRAEHAPKRPGKPPAVMIGWDIDRGTWRDDAPAGRAVSAIKVGNRMEAAAEWAGIHPSTLHKWLQIGRDAEPSPDFDRNEIELEKRPYVDFWRACSGAEAHAEVELVTLWRSAARTDWRAARDLLARRFPKKGWIEQRGLEVTGPDGGPVQIANVTDAALAKAIAADPKAIELANALLARIAPVAPPNAVAPDKEQPADDDVEGLAAELATDADLLDDDGVDEPSLVNDLSDHDDPRQVDQDIDYDGDDDDDL